MVSFNQDTNESYFVEVQCLCHAHLILTCGREYINKILDFNKDMHTINNQSKYSIYNFIPIWEGTFHASLQ